MVVDNTNSCICEEDLDKVLATSRFILKQLDLLSIFYEMSSS